MLLVCANLIQIDCLLCRGRPKKKKNNENLNFCFSWFESGKLLQESFKIQISLDFQHLFFRGLAGVLNPHKSCEPLLMTAIIMPLNKTQLPIWCTYIFSVVAILCTWILSGIAAICELLSPCELQLNSQLKLKLSISSYHYCTTPPESHETVPLIILIVICEKEESFENKHSRHSRRHFKLIQYLMSGLRMTDNQRYRVTRVFISITE